MRGEMRGCRWKRKEELVIRHIRKGISGIIECEVNKCASE